MALPRAPFSRTFVALGRRHTDAGEPIAGMLKDTENRLDSSFLVLHHHRSPCDSFWLLFLMLLLLLLLERHGLDGIIALKAFQMDKGIGAITLHG
jgi:hypothetical protein